MKGVIDKIIKNITKNPFILFVNGFLFVVMLILGGIFGVNDNTISIFSDNVYNYYISILSVNSSGFAFVFNQIFNIALCFVPVFLLSLNIYTFFINFIFVGYRGFILGISFRVILNVFSINGLIVWLFLIFLQNLILTFSICLFMCNAYILLNCKNKFYINKLFRYLIISLIVALIGVIIKCIFVFCIFKPLNLYF